MGQDDRPRPSRYNSAADAGAWDIVAYLLSGMLLWGGAGWLLDRWLDVRVFLPIGLLFGTGLALYIVYVLEILKVRRVRAWAESRREAKAEQSKALSA